MIRVLRLLFPPLSVGLLASAFFQGGFTWVAVVLLFLGVLWMIGLSLLWTWVSSLGLLSAFAAAAMGLFLDLSVVLIIPAAIFALMAWDIAGFYDRLSLASPDDDVFTLEQRHLVRLLAISVGGIGLSALALSAHLKFPFEWLVILVFFTVWAIGKVVGSLLKEG
jgi:hypothetical protein